MSGPQCEVLGEGEGVGESIWLSQMLLGVWMLSGVPGVSRVVRQSIFDVFQHLDDVFVVVVVAVVVVFVVVDVVVVVVVVASILDGAAAVDFFAIEIVSRDGGRCRRK